MNAMNQNPSDVKVGEALKAQRFRMLEDIARELAGDVVFPTSFDAALRLRKALQNADMSVAQMARIVCLEPLVATKLMTMANSALYSPDGVPAKGLQAVIQRLGVDLVRTTALGIAMGQLMRSKEMAGFSDLAQALWEHSLWAAAAARVLARTHTRIPPDEALLAGLVHDLGAFYMLYRATRYPELRARPDTLKFLILSWHESIGVSLLNALGVSDEVIEATVDHDQPRPLPEGLKTLSDIVYLGNILAGTHLEWSREGDDDVRQIIESAKRCYADLLPEIEKDALAMQAVFS